jgi:hypothetical protein
MFRTTLLLATLCALAACDKTSTPTAPPTTGINVGPIAVDPPVTAQGVRGTLRRTMVDSAEVQWDLELGDGTFYKLIGGPVDSYEALIDKQVFVTGMAQADGSFSVNTLEEDTQIYEAFRHRLPKK